ncbi:MAG: VCBS repeat-containing protein, partial [Planctomycetes bacterium]|nr:VCBS repeat-containing protein [Planctomycetota bacterium]
MVRRFPRRAAAARRAGIAPLVLPLLLVTACGEDRQTLAPGGFTVAPLRAAQSAEAGQPRFRLVPSTESGLTFHNELRRENRYTYLTNGAGLAVGDYDGDGRLDVYLVSQDGPNKLFRQTAPLRFEDVTAAAGGVDGGDAWGSGASFADVDGDGDLDLYVCNIEAKNLLYVNQGDGTFVEDAAAFGLDLVAASTMAAFADYDRDGRLDLYLLTNRALHAGWALTPEVLDGFRPPADTLRSPREMVPSAARFAAAQREVAPGDEHFFRFRGRTYTAGQPDRLLRNVDGKFVDVTDSAGIADHGMGLSATWFDYDGDGAPDLYVANDLETPDVLYHNEGDGTFREVTRDAVPHTAYYGMGSDA